MTTLGAVQGEIAGHLQRGVEESDGTVRVYQDCLRDWHTAVVASVAEIERLRAALVDERAAFNWAGWATATEAERESERGYTRVELIAEGLLPPE